jgi:N-acetyl-anhydromuramyl-L-alanine amidase AmpD
MSTSVCLSLLREFFHGNYNESWTLTKIQDVVGVINLVFTSHANESFKIITQLFSSAHYIIERQLYHDILGVVYLVKGDMCT